MRLKEPFSAISHAIGACLACVGLIVLLVLAHGRYLLSLSFAIYGVSLVVLYSASALYHSLRVRPQVVDRLKRFDHIAIYLLIAGTYTPLCLQRIGGPRGLWILTAEYTLAGIGCAATLLWRNAPEWVRVALYVCMGWLIVPVLHSVSSSLGPEILGWLVAGGIAYTLGTVIFATERPRLWPGRFGSHDLWHIFVLAGSICHFVMMTKLANPQTL